MFAKLLAVLIAGACVCYSETRDKDMTTTGKGTKTCATAPYRYLALEVTYIASTHKGAPASFPVPPNNAGRRREGNSVWRSPARARGISMPVWQFNVIC